MARGGVTYSDIANAAETIKNAGHNPTVDRVLNKLGTGSKSTIGPHLKSWKVQHSEQSEANDLPMDLLKSVRELHQRLQTQAEEKVKKAEQQNIDQKIGHAHEVEKITQHIQSLAKTLNEIKDERNNLYTENENLIKDLTKANLNAVKLESKNKSEAKLILELTTSKNEITHQLKLAHEQQEHFQLKAAEERYIERNENQAVKVQLKTQIKEQSRQLLSADERDTYNRNEKNELLKEIQAITTSLRFLECDNAKKDNLITSLTVQADLNMVTIKETSEANVKLNDLKLSSSNQISSLTSECTILNEQLSIVRQDITKIQQRLEIKIEEHQVARQEKSVLHTQLKLLQNSL